MTSADKCPTTATCQHLQFDQKKVQRPPAKLPKGLVDSKCTAVVNIAGISCSCLLDTPASFYNQHLSDQPIKPLDDLLEVEGAA